MNDTVRYDIVDFEWDAQSKTFSGYGNALYDFDRKYNAPFSNDKKQFVIYNPNTEGFRRFRFLREETFGGCTEYIFESEDGFTARILMTLETYPPEYEGT